MRRRRPDRAMATAACLVTLLAGLEAAGAPSRAHVTRSPVGLDQDVVVSLADVSPGARFQARVVVVSTFMRGLCVEREVVVGRSTRTGRLRLRFARSTRFGLWCQGSAYRGAVQSLGGRGRIIARFGFHVMRIG